MRLTLTFSLLHALVSEMQSEWEVWLFPCLCSCRLRVHLLHPAGVWWRTNRGEEATTGRPSGSARRSRPAEGSWRTGRRSGRRRQRGADTPTAGAAGGAEGRWDCSYESLLRISSVRRISRSGNDSKTQQRRKWRMLLHVFSFLNIYSVCALNTNADSLYC